jgi:hypothetical protein
MENVKQIYVVNAKLRFKDNTEDTFQFYADVDTPGKAETKIEKWLLEGNSNLKFTEILSIRADHNIWVVI